MKSKSVTLKEFHTLDGIQIEDRDLEDLAEDMVEVKVHYCGVNFADLYTIHQLAGGQVPAVLGIECSGVVTQVGSDSSTFKTGDKVICYDYKGGLHRSVVRVKQEKCYAVPENVDLKTAASIFVNYVTAWFALFALGNLKDGDSVFVSSCAGGVGLAIVELAKSKQNVTIYGTASSLKRNFVETKGVRFVDYDKLPALEAKFDLVIESMSTETRKVLSSKLNPFGKVIIIGAKRLIPAPESTPEDPKIDPVELIFRNSIVGGLHIGLLADNHPDLIRKALNSIFAQLVPDNIKSKTYAFSDARRAYEDLANRTNIGKILLQL